MMMLLCGRPMKTLAKVYSSLMTEQEAISLMLKEQHHIILLPKSLTQKHGIMKNELAFDVVKTKKGMLSLIGRDSVSFPRVTKSPGSEETAI